MMARWAGSLLVSSSAKPAEEGLEFKDLFLFFLVAFVDKLDMLISYMEVLEKQLRVMDMTAISLAMDNNLPLAVFKLKDKGNIRRVVCGENIGTLIDN